MIDAHCHLAAVPTKTNGCRISARMLKGPVARFIAWKEGLPLDEPERANELYVDKLVAELSRSKRVSHAVLLGMDGVYGPDGRLDESRTDFLISNDAVFEACARSPKLLPGISINPTRRDALEELERCAAKGAALVKMLPNAQSFDPAAPALKPFWRAAARLKLPVLSHIGFEFSLIGQDQSVGDLLRLVPALDEGATVIAAHGCSQGLYVLEKHLPAMLDLVARYPRFYSDLSALTLPNRVGALLRLRGMKEVFPRLVFGTDYPLPVLGWGVSGSWDNRFDKQAAALEAFGVPPGQDLAELLPKTCRVG